MKLIPVSDRSGTYKATKSDLLASTFPVGKGTIGKLDYPVYAVETGGVNEQTPVVYVFRKVISELSSGIQEFCGRVAENEKLVFLAKSKDQTLYKYDISTNSQTAIYSFLGQPNPASLYWDSATGNLWIMEESFGSSSSREFRLTVIDRDGNVVRATQNMPGEVDKTGNNQIAEGRYCVVGRTMYLPKRSTGGGELVCIDLDTFTTRIVSSGLTTAPTYVKAGFQSENLVFFGQRSYAGYLDTTTDTAHWFDFSYSYEATKYPALVSAGWGQYDKAYAMKIYSYRKPDHSIGHRIMIQGEKANMTLETQSRWYIFEIDLDKISTDKYNCIVDGSHQSIKMNKEDFGSLDNVTKGGLDLVINDEVLPGVMFFAYASGQHGSSGNIVCISNDGGLTQSHFMGVGKEPNDVSWINNYGLWNDAGVVDGSIYIVGYEGLAKLSPYITPGSSMLAYEDQNIRVPAEHLTSFLFGD